MSNLNDLATSTLLIVGSGFMVLAGVGVLRMPDLFMRMQAATKAATLGTGCMLMAVAIHFGELAVATRALLVTAFVFLTAPVAAHMIARAAYGVGTPLWEGTVADQLGEARQREAQQREAQQREATLSASPATGPAEPRQDPASDKPADKP